MVRVGSDEPERLKFCPHPCVPSFLLQLATAALRRSVSPSISSAACRGLASAANLKVSPPTPQKKERIKYFKVYRYDPEQDQAPYLSTYPVNLDECGPMVLGKASCDGALRRFQS
jgi:hypothetical protein